MKVFIALLSALLFADAACAQQQNVEVETSRDVAVLRYPILGNNPFPLLKGRDLKEARKALALARLLTQECECDKALSDYGIESLYELLKMEVNADVFDGRSSTLEMSFPGKTAYRETIASYFEKTINSVVAVVAAKSFTGSVKMIFLNGYFFNPTIDAATALQQRAVILIHESVHQFADKGDHVFGGSRVLTGKIIEKCLPGLNYSNRLGKITSKD